MNNDLTTNNKSVQRPFDEDDLWSYFKTTKKTIQEYVRALDKYNAFRSLAPQFREEVCVDDRGILIDLYDACYDQDAHLMSTMETLYSKILGKRYSLGTIDKKGKFHKDIEATKKIQGSVFVDLIKEIIKAKAYGYTVIEIMPWVDTKTGKLCHIKSIERRNVLPGQRRIVKRQGEFDGWSLDAKEIVPFYFMVEDATHPLGFYSATTPIILAKKFTHANHVGFSHTYGQPIIHGKTTNEQESDRRKLANDIASAATNKVIVTGIDDTIDVKNFASTNSEKIFTSIEQQANTDVSNLILGSESMAGTAQSYVGAAAADENILRERVSVYREFVENVFNEEVIPRMVDFGYIKPGLVFQYQQKMDLSAKDLIAMLDVLTKNYEIDSETIEDITGIHVGSQIIKQQGQGIVPKNALNFLSGKEA